MKRIIIIGAGGFGRELLTWVRQSLPDVSVKGFLDDNLQALEKFNKGVPVLGRVQDYEPVGEDLFICALGRIEYKRQCIERILARGGVFTKLIHPSVVLGDDVVIGKGAIICPYAVVGADARLGDFVTVNIHSMVAHDVVLGRWTQLHCHVSITGGAVLGEGVAVGNHASVQPGVRVGDGAVIGAGALVTEAVPPGATVYAAPSRSALVQEVLGV